ncbi:MAG: hypothetical protein ACLGJB_07885 [Blastocatellia bacterium]
MAYDLRTIEGQSGVSLVAVAEWVQVEILEGWRTPGLVFTDENVIEQAPGVH